MANLETKAIASVCSMDFQCPVVVSKAVLRIPCLSFLPNNQSTITLLLTLAQLCPHSSLL